MKKVLLTAVVSALLVASCSQEEVVENVSNPQLKTRSAESEVKVEDGILTFSNYEAYRKVYEDLHKLNKDELTVWNQGYTSMLCQESFSPNRLAAEENAKSSYNTDDGIFKLAPEGQFVYGAATGYFDCYKNDVSGEEHYKCHFILN